MNDVNALKSIAFRFENASKRRYYRVILSQDLLGDWVITKVWGGINQATGRITHLPCANYTEGEKLLLKFKQIRMARGYTLCEIRV